MLTRNKENINFSRQENMARFNIIQPTTTLISKNISIGKKRTSIRLEAEMWQSLKEIAQRERCSVNDICTLVYICKRPLSSLTASIRVFIMLYFKAAATEEGHRIARHGDLKRIKSKLEPLIH